MYLINSYGTDKKKQRTKKTNKKTCFSRQDSRWNLQTEIYFIIKRNFNISVLHIHVHVNTMYIEYVTAFINGAYNCTCVFLCYFIFPNILSSKMYLDII